MKLRFRLWHLFAIVAFVGVVVWSWPHLVVEFVKEPNLIRLTVGWNEHRAVILDFDTMDVDDRLKYSTDKLSDSLNEHLRLSHEKQKEQRKRDSNRRVPVGGPYLGVGLGRIVDGEKCVVRRIAPASPAERAGIKQGDIIVSFDGQEVESFAVLRDLVRSKKATDKVEVKIIRGAVDKVVTVVLSGNITRIP
jgi:C-terminal processing protease CtpA/Prc